jgi:methyl-accepting chemotaxis protein
MLNMIFSPAMAVMSRLRFALKLGLMSLLFLAPLSGLVYYLYGKLHADIDFGETERAGVQQIMPGRYLAQALQAHRGASQIALGGDAAAKEKLAGFASAVDARLAALEAKTAGTTLGTAESVAGIRTNWLDLKEKGASLTPEDNLQAHNKLVRSVLDYVELTSDKSGLTLDPDMDSFYLMDAAIFRMTRVADYAGRLRARGSGVLQRKVKTPLEDARLQVLREMYKVYFGTLQTDLAKSFGANTALPAALDAKSKEARAAGDEFLKTEVDALVKGDLTLDPQVYFASATKTIDSLYGLFDATIEQLDGLLAARVHRLTTNLNFVLYGTGGVLLVVMYLFGGMLMSVLRSLKSIEGGAERLARGDVSQAVDSHSRDELREVGGAVNSVVETLQKFTKAQLDMARAHNEEGRVSEAMRAADLPGAYGDMARNLNAMVEGHIDVQTRFVDLMVEYAGGKFETRMAPLPGERKAISDTAERLRGVLLKAQDDARETLKIKIALDNSSSCVMMADAEGIVRYQNNACDALMRASESNFRSTIAGFSAAGVVGSSFDQFHKNPSRQRGMVAGLKGEYRTQLEIGGLHMRAVANPIVDENGARLGVVVEWLDRTAEVNAEKEIGAIVEAAAAGDFAKRIAEAGKAGFMLQMAQGLNSVLSTSEQALGEISRILKAMAAGDLAQTIEADFKGVFADLKDNSNGTIERLREIIAQIREASESINTAAREIAMGNNDLSRRTEEQASSLEETAASLEEFASSVRQNAENAQEANRLAAGASEAAQRGGDVVGHVVTTMAGITESNREIADITTLIDGIAFQTNLLALNAAVEAARAGEQGRGFAVVASEVRTLAQRAAEAAKDIKAVIAASVGKVDEGAKLVSSAGAAMEEIVAQVGRVSAIIGEIAAASKEQSTGIDQVNQAVTSIDQITQQNAALVEEATAAAKSMEEQSDALVQSVAAFKLSSSDADAARGKPTRPAEHANGGGLPNGRALH